MRYHCNSIAQYYATGQEAKLREQLQDFNNSVKDTVFDKSQREIINFITSKSQLLEKVLASPFNYGDNQHMRETLIHTCISRASIDSINVLYKKRVIAEHVRLENLILNNRTVCLGFVNYAIHNENIFVLQRYYNFELFYVRKVIINNSLDSHDLAGIERLLGNCNKEQIEQIKGEIDVCDSFAAPLAQHIKLPKSGAIKKKLSQEFLMTYIEAWVEREYIEKNTKVQVSLNKVNKL